MKALLSFLALIQTMLFIAIKLVLLCYAGIVALIVALVWKKCVFRVIVTGDFTKA